MFVCGVDVNIVECVVMCVVVSVCECALMTPVKGDERVAKRVMKKLR